MIGWIFAGITLSAVLMATFENHMRRAVLALWVAGIGVGAMYLTVGAEFLAVIQWIVSTLTAISFIFFSVMFGEYHSPTPKAGVQGRLFVILALILGATFAAVIGIGSEELRESTLTLVLQESDLGTIGKKLTAEHLLSLEVLALTLFLVLVGGGVIARNEGGNAS
jgi:NADH:ubiquinone oxidoreductase subunit 6 (subunit J)